MTIHLMCGVKLDVHRECKVSGLKCGIHYSYEGYCVLATSLFGDGLVGGNCVWAAHGPPLIN